MVVSRMVCSRVALLVFFVLLLPSCEGRGASAPPSSAGETENQGVQCLEAASAKRTIPAEAPDSISVAHILVRHAQLQHPQGATRSKLAACMLALDALAELQDGAEWNAAVDRFSDSGKSMHGQLGKVRRDELSSSFADAAFSLHVDELSYVVETDRGFHIILRTN